MLMLAYTYRTLAIGMPILVYIVLEIVSQEQIQCPKF